MNDFPLADDQVAELWREIIRIRMVEEAIANRYSEQKMRCPTHLSIGQEAVPAIVCRSLSVKDKMLSTHRAHAHYLAKGGSLNAMIAELHGKSTGCSGGFGGSMHLIDIAAGFMGSTAIVGNTIPVGVGYALAEKVRGQQGVVVVCVGDAATEEGAFYEAVNFAAVKQLPVLFLCENNSYSVYSDLSVRQPAGRKIADMVEAMGVPSQTGDGYDLAEVLHTSTAAIERIRHGDGPQFLEYQTFRWREHCGPNFDNDIGYRTIDEFNSWVERDLVSKLEQQLHQIQENWSRLKHDFLSAIKREIDSAFELAENAGFPVEIAADAVNAASMVRSNE